MSLMLVLIAPLPWSQSALPASHLTIDQVATGLEATWSACRWLHLKETRTPNVITEKDASPQHPDRIETEYWHSATDGKCYREQVVYRGGKQFHIELCAWDGRRAYRYSPQKDTNEMSIIAGSGGYHGNVTLMVSYYEYYGLIDRDAHARFHDLLRSSPILPSYVKVLEARVVGTVQVPGATLVRVVLVSNNGRIDIKQEMDLDPAKGFWPHRRVTWIGKKLQKVGEIQYREFQKASAVWFPKVVWNAEEKSMHYVTLVEAGAEFPPERFRIDPPKGTRVRDIIERRMYFVGGDEGEAKFRRSLANEARQPAANQPEPPLQATPGFWSDYWWTIVLASVGLGILVLALVVRRRANS